MKEGILLIGVILLLVPSISGDSIPFSDVVELKNFGDQYTKDFPLSVYVRKGSAYEIENRLIQINIGPKECVRWEENGIINENKDYFYTVFVSIVLIDSNEEVSEDFTGYLNLELENCDAAARKALLFWDHAGEPVADRAGQTFEPGDSLVVQDEYFTVTLTVTDVKGSINFCDTTHPQYLNCRSDAACLGFMDALTLRVDITYSCEECYTNAAENLNEGNYLLREAAQIEDYEEAIGKYEDARSHFEEAQKQFEEVGAAQAGECQILIDRCNEEIAVLEGVGRLRIRLILIFGAIAVAASAGTVFRRIGKWRAPPPKEGITLRVLHPETGREVAIQVERYDKMGKVRQLAGTKLGMTSFDLFSGEKVCPPEKTVQECGLQDGAVLSVSARKEDYVKIEQKPAPPQEEEGEKKPAFSENQVLPPRDAVTSKRGRVTQRRKSAPKRPNVLNYCYYCGNRIGPSDTYCLKCGRKLRDKDAL